VQKRVEEATKVLERAIKRILGEEKMHEGKELHSVHLARHKVPKCDRHRGF
jgi:hypothetical protein